VSAFTGAAGRDLPPGQGRELGKQDRLVALDREEVIGTVSGQVGGVAALGMHRICGDDRAGDVYEPQQNGEHRDLVRLGAGPDLA
jgi:hypothetical protein